MKTEKITDRCIKDAFTFINRYYYIENKSINYSNALGQHINNGLVKFYEIINEIIDENEIDLLTKL